MPGLVSIIIPCHNAAPWLGETLLSAVAQTWPEKETIVVDDGSTDASVEIARRFEGRGVRVVTQANRGASAARNRGLSLARGEWIQFLDADDLLSPGKISSQIEVLGGSPSRDVASCRWGRFESDPAGAKFVDEPVFRDFSPAREFLILAAATGFMIQPAAWLCPRGLLDRAGPWDESLTLNDDGEYFCRVLAVSGDVKFSAKGCVRYRSSLGGSLSRRRSAAALDSLYRSHALFDAVLRSTEDSPRVRAVLCNFWERCRYELYPDSPGQSAAAGRRARALGTPTVRPALGPRLGLVARVMGWKSARRLQEWTRSR